MSNTLKIGPLRVRPHIRNGVETGKWFLDIPASLTSNGQRKRKLFDNRIQALNVARELERKMRLRSLGYVEGPARSNILFREAAIQWEENEWARVRTLKKRAISLETDLFRLKSLIAYFSNHDLKGITEQEIVSYQERRLKMERRPATINSEVVTLFKVLRWTVRNKTLDNLPQVERIPEQLKEVVIPTPEEVSRIISFLPKSAASVIWFIAETGCRSGEVFNLTWDCVDEINGTVTIRAKEGWTPKTRSSQRRIPIQGALLEMIRTLPKTGAYVFPSHKDPTKRRNNVRKVLANAVRKAKLTRDGLPIRVTPHVLRKAFATWLAMGGTPQRVLQSLLGHAPGSAVTDTHYVQASEEAKRAAIIRLPCGERINASVS
jgi:integrase